MNHLQLSMKRISPCNLQSARYCHGNSCSESARMFKCAYITKMVKFVEDKPFCDATLYHSMTIEHFFLTIIQTIDWTSLCRASAIPVHH